MEALAESCLVREGVGELLLGLGQEDLLLVLVKPRIQGRPLWPK